MDTLTPGKYVVSAEVEVLSTSPCGDVSVKYRNGKVRYIDPDRYDWEPSLPDEPPVNAVIIDRDGEAWQRFNEDGDSPDGWSIAGYVGDYEFYDLSWETLNEKYGPLKVVYVPEPDDS